jgi:hypothetical protein
MNLEIKYADGTKRTVGDRADIETCLTIDIGSGWVESNGLVWSRDAAEEHPEDDGVYASAEILLNGNRASLDELA